MAVLPPPPPMEPPQPPAYPPQTFPAQQGVYAGTLPQPDYAGTYAAIAPSVLAVRGPRTGLVLVAEILMVVKGVFWLIAGMGLGAFGIYLIAHGADFRLLNGSRNYPGLGTIDAGLTGLVIAFLIAGAALCLAVGVADITLGVSVGRRSNAARWLTVVLNSVAAIIALMGLIGQLSRSTAGSVAQHSTAGAVFLAVWLAVNIVIFYALVIDGRSRQAFG